MSRTEVNLTFPLTALAGGNIAANKMVVFDGNGAVVEAGAGSRPVGWVNDAVASGAYTEVNALSGRVALIGGGTTAIGNYVKCGADGKVVAEGTVTTPTAFTIGQAASVGGTGAISYVICC